MLDRLLSYSLKHRWLMLSLVVAMAALGIFNYERLPIDAVPDITNVQVQINTEAPGYSPTEVEQRITYPVEAAVVGLPQLDYSRSISRYGLSQVTVIFEDGTDIYLARQLIGERLNEVKALLPEGIEPGMGPIATGLGEIFIQRHGGRQRRGSPEAASGYLGGPGAHRSDDAADEWLAAPARHQGELQRPPGRRLHRLHI